MNNPKPKEWTSEQYSKGKIASYKPYNFVDGEGVRCSLYVSGCLFACEGCYNVIAQNFNYGIQYAKELEEQISQSVTESLWKYQGYLVLDRIYLGRADARNRR